jgi:hypothetical protein
MPVSFLKKYSIEAAIIAGFLVLLVAAVVYSRLQDGGANAQPQTAALRAALHDTPSLDGLRKDAGKAPVSLDVISQSGQQVTLAGAKGAVSVSFSPDRALTFSGWAVDGDAANAADGVYLVVDGSRRFPAAYGIDRPDVAQAFHAPNAERSGFAVDVPPHVFHAGAYRLGLLVVDKSGKGYYVDAPQVTIVFGDQRR